MHKSEKMSAAEVIRHNFMPAVSLITTIQSIRWVTRGWSFSKCIIGKLKLNIFRDNAEYQVVFKNGVASSPLKRSVRLKKKGDKITFLPSKEIFSSINFNSNITEEIKGASFFK